MEYERIREKIALLINDAICQVVPEQPERDTLSQFTQPERDFLFENANQILSLVEIKADDQSLPELEFEEIENTAAQMSSDDFAKVLAIMAVWVERMKKVGFVKCLKKEEHGS